MLGSLRHAQLRAAGAPRVEESLNDLIVSEGGTLWHKKIEKIFAARGIPVIKELKLNPFLPKGWGGRLDWLVWDIKNKEFTLHDLKTTTSDNLYWRTKNGPKEDHIWQLSSYYRGLESFGFPLAKRCSIIYFPTDRPKGSNDEIEPIEVLFEPIPKDIIWKVMEERYEAVTAYLDTIPNIEHPEWRLGKTYIKKPENQHLLFLNKNLSEPIQREQKLFKNKDKYDLKLVPHWSTRYCPYDDKLCDCSNQGSTKIGEYAYEGTGADRLVYFPRKGYEDIKPLLTPGD